MSLHKKVEDPSTKTLLNSISGDLDLQITPLSELCFNEMERTRYYSIIWVKKGRGKVLYEFNEHNFQTSSILFFAPHQPFVFRDGQNISGVTLHFSGDFYCIEKHRREISCSGVLFNNVYESLVINIGNEKKVDFEHLLKSMQNEFENNSKPDPEMLLSYLKIFLIKATRVKKNQQERIQDRHAADVDNPKLIELRRLIEENYRNLKSPSDYASELFITTKALGRLVKDHFNKTLTNLIQERIIIEAKRELVLTDKMVKEIAHELGYEDQYYFSRLFKKITDVPPQEYRDSYTMV